MPPTHPQTRQDNRGRRQNVKNKRGDGPRDELLPLRAGLVALPEDEARTHEVVDRLVHPVGCWDSLGFLEGGGGRGDCAEGGSRQRTCTHPDTHTPDVAVESVGGEVLVVLQVHQHPLLRLVWRVGERERACACVSVWLGVTTHNTPYATTHTHTTPLSPFHSLTPACTAAASPGRAGGRTNRRGPGTSSPPSRRRPCLFREGGRCGEPCVSVRVRGMCVCRLPQCSFFAMRCVRARVANAWMFFPVLSVCVPPTPAPSPSLPTHPHASRSASPRAVPLPAASPPLSPLRHGRGLGGG